MLLRVALASDDREICRQLSDLLVDMTVRNDFAGEEIELDIAYFGDDMNALAAAYKDMDIAFLTYDVLDAHPAAARSLYAANPRCFPVVVGLPDERICSFLSLRPAEHLGKLTDDLKVERVCVACLELLQSDSHVIQFKTRRGSYSISTDSVLFCVSDLKYISIVTDSGRIYRKPGKLSDLVRQMPANFIRVHQSYLVNVQRVVSLDKSTWEIVCDDETRIPVSRAYHQTAQDLFKNAV